MSFGDGNLHDEVDRLKAERVRMCALMRFVLDRMLENSPEYPHERPMTWQYIQRELEELEA